MMRSYAESGDSPLVQDIATTTLRVNEGGRNESG